MTAVSSNRRNCGLIERSGSVPWDVIDRFDGITRERSKQTAAPRRKHSRFRPWRINAGARFLLNLSRDPSSPSSAITVAPFPPPRGDRIRRITPSCLSPLFRSPLAPLPLVADETMNSTPTSWTTALAYLLALIGISFPSARRETDERRRTRRTGEGRECSRGTTRDSSAFPLDHLSILYLARDTYPFLSLFHLRAPRERAERAHAIPLSYTAPPSSAFLVNAAGTSFRARVRMLLQDITTASEPLLLLRFDAALASVSLAHLLSRNNARAPPPPPVCECIAMHSRNCYSVVGSDWTEFRIRYVARSLSGNQ